MLNWRLVASEGDPVDPSSLLTQLGSLKVKPGMPWWRREFSFRSALRENDDESYMSVIAGRLPPEDVVPMVNRGDRAGSADAVRYASAEELMRKGFTVTHMPERLIPDHVAVAWEGAWDNVVAARFDSCFHEYVPGLGGGDE